MKKIVVILSFALVLFACGDSNSPAVTNGETNSSENANPDYDPTRGRGNLQHKMFIWEQHSIQPWLQKVKIMNW